MFPATRGRTALSRYSRSTKARLSAPSPQRRHHDEAEDQRRQRIFQRVVHAAIPFLDLAARKMDLVELAEHLVEHADALAVDVLGCRRLDNVVTDPAVDRGHEAVLHRALDVAEQDDAVDVGRILGAVDEGLVEHESLAVAPDAFDAIDEDAALVRVRRNDAEVIAQRAREGIAMRP